MKWMDPKDAPQGDTPILVAEESGTVVLIPAVDLYREYQGGGVYSEPILIRPGGRLAVGWMPVPEPPKATPR